MEVALYHLPDHPMRCNEPKRNVGNVTERMLTKTAPRTGKRRPDRAQDLSRRPAACGIQVEQEGQDLKADPVGAMGLGGELFLKVRLGLWAQIKYCGRPCGPAVVPG